MKPIKLSSHEHFQPTRFHRLLLVVAVAAIAVIASIGMPELRLVGTNPGQVGSPFAIIENAETGSQDIFELDKHVFGEAQLVSIDTDKVTLMVNEELITLKLKSSDKQIASNSQLFSDLEVAQEANESFALNAEESLVKEHARAEDGSSIVVLSGEVVEQHFSKQNSSLAESVAKTNPQPVIEEGQLIGVSLSAIEDQSLLAQIGLQSGDVVTRINGQQVSSLAQGIELAEKSNWSDIEVIRNGEPVKLGVSVAYNQ